MQRNIGEAREGSGRFVVDLLGDPASLLSERIVPHHGSRSFFLSDIWRGAWMASKPTGAAAWALRETSGAIIGVFGVMKSRSSPVIGRRAAYLHEWGSPEHDAVYVEDNDLLMTDERDSDAFASAIATAFGIPGIDSVVIRNAAPRLVSAAERAAAAAGWSSEIFRQQPKFSIDLDRLRATGGNYLATRSGSLRAKIERARRRYEERGSVELRAFRRGPERDAAWLRLRRLHEAGGSRRGRTSAFSNPAFRAFHERLAADHPDVTEILELSAGGAPVASLYFFLHEGRALNYQSGILIEDVNQLTPGLLAHALAIEHFRARGFAGYDLLAGDAEYKRRLADESGVLKSILLERRSGARAGLRRLLRSLRDIPAKRAERFR